MKIVSVIGARPQFIKAAPLSRQLRKAHHEVLVHTGQHYDERMSKVFFDELQIPEPDHHLGVGSGPHGAQTGAMLARVEAVLVQEKPDLVLVYGDTNSTLAGALAAVKLHVPVAHVEAGLRSFNRAMPEEINRVITDHVSVLLFCPSETAAKNLAAEGIGKGVHVVGDIMADALQEAAERARSRSGILQRLGLSDKGYLLATVHRAENTDHWTRLQAIVEAFSALNQTIVLPLHPRTVQALSRAGLSLSANVKVIEPVGYLDMVRLEQSARAILTDSGGIQKEAYWLGIPCVTLRDETEWVETVEVGWNTVVGASRERILAAARSPKVPEVRPPLYGDGKAASAIAAYL